MVNEGGSLSRLFYLKIYIPVITDVCLFSILFFCICDETNKPLHIFEEQNKTS